jgi:hypothetical protein
MAVAIVSSSANARDLDRGFAGRRSVGDLGALPLRPLGMVDSSRRGQFGASAGAVLDVVHPAHPLAAGAGGSVAVTDRRALLAWGIPGREAEVVATLDGEKAAIFAYEKGAGLSGLDAPERRVGLFLPDASASGLRDRGWAFFDAAVRWAAHASPPEPLIEPPPTATPSTSPRLGGGTRGGDPPPQVLLVVRGSANAGDLDMQARLIALGFAVLIRPDTTVTAADTAGKVLAILSGDVVLPQAITPTFAGLPIPLIVQGSGSFDDMWLVGAADRGVAAGQTHIVIADPSIPFPPDSRERSPWPRPRVPSPRAARTRTGGSSPRWPPPSSRVPSPPRVPSSSPTSRGRRWWAASRRRAASAWASTTSRCDLRRLHGEHGPFFDLDQREPEHARDGRGGSGRR